MSRSPNDGPVQLYEDPYDPIVSYSYAAADVIYGPHPSIPNHWVVVREMTPEEIYAVESVRAREQYLQEAQRKARAVAKEAEDARRTALYRLRNAQGELLYVGISATPPQRWGKHAIDKEWWPEVTDLSLEWFDTKSEALTHEEAAIKSEKPRYNIQHNDVAP